MNRLLVTLFCLAFAVSAIQAQDEDSPKKKGDQDKKITIITGQSNADGKSEVREQILEECIVSLPTLQELEPQVQSEPIFLKEINGDPAKNDFTKTYTATVEINYMLHQKALIIVTTNSVGGAEPVMKVVEKKIKQSRMFTSNPSEGDLYAGRSHRQYYFSSAEGATADVRNRVKVWLKEQGAVICKAK